MHQLTLNVGQLEAVLQVGANPMRCLPGHHLIHQPRPRIAADLKCRIKHDFCHGAPLAGGKATHLLRKPGEGRVCEAHQGLKSDHITVISGRSLAQDLNGTLSLQGMHDASGPVQHDR